MCSLIVAWSQEIYSIKVGGTHEIMGWQEVNAYFQGKKVNRQHGKNVQEMFFLMKVNLYIFSLNE